MNRLWGIMDLRQGVKINNNLLSYFLAVNLYVIRGSVFHITENIIRQQTTTLYKKKKWLTSPYVAALEKY